MSELVRRICAGLPLASSINAETYSPSGDFRWRMQLLERTRRPLLCVIRLRTSRSNELIVSKVNWAGWSILLAACSELLVGFPVTQGEGLIGSKGERELKEGRGNDGTRHGRALEELRVDI